MNEMRLLEEFCAQEPPPAPHRLARARAAMAAAIGDGRTPGVAVGRGAVGPRWGRRRPGLLARPWLTAAVAMGTAAAVAVGATAAVNAGLFRAGAHTAGTAAPLAAPPPGASGTQLAVYVLDRAAATALAAPTPSDGQFIYTDVHYVGGEGYGLFAHQQTWQSVNGQRPGARRVSKCFSPFLFKRPVPAKIPASWILPYCLNEIGVLHHSAHNAISFDRTYAGLQALPTDPRALLAYLEQNNSCDTEAGFGLPKTVAAYAEIYMILGTVQVLPPKFGAALFHAAAMIPGITVQANAANAAGGRGLAVSLTYQPGTGTLLSRHEIFFDSQTYRFLGEQRIAAGASGGFSAGALVDASWLRSYSIVNSAPTNYTPAPPDVSITYTRRHGKVIVTRHTFRATSSVADLGCA